MKITIYENQLRVFETKEDALGWLQTGKILYELPLNQIGYRLGSFNDVYSKVLVDLSQIEGFNSDVAYQMVELIKKYSNEYINWSFTFNLCGLEYNNADPAIKIMLLMKKGFTHFIPLTDREGYKIVRLSPKEEVKPDYVSLKSLNAENVLILNEMQCFEIQDLVD